MGNKRQIADLQLDFEVFIGEKGNFIGCILGLVDQKACITGKKQ
jgi:hypothetical protein